MNNSLPRSAGVLLHISSLPSAFGIGDMGPEAFSFADFLFRSQQTFWQILPLNPAGASVAFSPYSSYSSMAGNVYLISPEQLVIDRLLTQQDVEAAKIPFASQADLAKAATAKEQLLALAYTRYIAEPSAELRQAYASFYGKHEYWLRDYSHYVLLRTIHEQKAWFQWPDPYKVRDTQALESLEITYRAQLDEIRWQQMIFHRQWESLRSYCASLNLRILGDIPFYVAYDSADVWASPRFFTVTEHGDLTAVAGVPPDAFNSNGQLWGMPVYDWKALKKHDYKWWITRLQKNVDMFDLVRIDHFRALASYWVVPPSEKNAIRGEWKKAPGKAFLKEVNRRLNGLPIVAEDLGDIEDDVYELRDAFALPGMNVLQFAFGKDMPVSPYIPHNNIRNSLIYTGTHDNNTTKGWYASLPALERTNLDQYFGTAVKETNVCQLLSRLAYSSVSAVAILPMQDVAELDESARMNTPAGEGLNWAWRLDKSLVNASIENKLIEWCNVYNRRRDGDTSYATAHHE